MGKPVRNKIIDDIGVKLEVVQDTRDIKLRGTKEKIDEAVVVVKEFLSANFTVMYEVAAEDTSLLLGGGVDSVIKTLADKFECDVHMQRDTNMVRIRGVQNKVHAALSDLKKTIHGGEGMVVEDLKVAENVMGKVIGKGGAKINEVEAAHKIRINILQNSNVLRLRGEEANVLSAIREIIVFVANQKVNETVPVEDQKLLPLLGAKGSLFKKIHARGVTPVFKAEKSEVRLRGYPEDVEEAKRMMAEESKGGVFKVKVALDECHLKKVGQISSPHWERIVDSSNATVAIELNGVSIVGKRKEVVTALEQTHAFFQFCLNEQFSKVDVGSGELTGAFTPGDLLLIGFDTATTLTRDFVTECIFVRTTKGKEEVDKALAGIDKKLKSWSSLHAYIKVEDWAIPLIIGSKGAMINKIMDETKCEINIEGTTVEVSGNDEDVIARGRDAIEKLLEENKIWSVKVDLPKDSRGNFIGKGGANIKVLKAETGGMYEVVDGGDGVMVKGSEEEVAKAKEAIENWVEVWKEKVSEGWKKATAKGVYCHPTQITILHSSLRSSPFRTTST